MKTVPFAGLLLLLIVPVALAGGGGFAPIAEEAADVTPEAKGGTALATFAGGCFWCMEPPFDALEGVHSTTSGYIGGRVVEPSYEQVSSGGTGHIEAVQVVYDPALVDYETLLDVFWRNVDPTDAGGQFCDRGEQYGTAIFVHTPEQRMVAEASRRSLIESHRLGAPIVTPIRFATEFYVAEDYHQNYYETHPVRYKFYRRGCGRDGVLERLWGGSAP
jgi:peptide-methionine (S)-S-oxide reductase